MTWQNSIPQAVMKTLKKSWDDRMVANPAVPGSDKVTMLIPVRKTAMFSGHDYEERTLGGNLEHVWSSGTHPATLEQALDALHPVELNVIMMVYGRLVAIDKRLWEGVLWIRDTWLTGSAGFKCRYVDRAKQRELYNQLWICQDMGMGAGDHPGCDCWREIPVSGGEQSLHLLIGNNTLDVTEPERLDEIHIDWKSPVVGSRNNVCELGVWASVAHTAQAIFGFSVPASPFLFAEVAADAAARDAQLHFLTDEDKQDIATMRDTWNRSFREWSVLGQKGWDLAQPNYQKIVAYRDKWKTVPKPPVYR